MLIAHLIDSLHVGGAEKLQLTFVREARAQGHEVLLIALRADEDTLVRDEATRLGARVVTVAGRGLADPLRLWRLLALLRQQRPDVLHCHLTYAIILGSLAGRAAGVPVVATLHSAQLDPAHSALKHRLEAWALRWGSNAVVAVGQHVAEAHQSRLGGQGVAVIPNAVAVGALPAQRDEAHVPSHGHLISVGRLVEAKGFEDLIEGFANLHRSHPSATLRIVGDGPLREPLAAAIEARGLAGHVDLLGTRDDVPALLAASDLYVSASHWEGLPLATLEAMAAGLPVVATAVGEVPSLLAEGRGVVVPPRAPAALAAALRALLDDPTRGAALAAAGQRYVLAQHAPEQWLRQLLALYETVIEAAHAGKRVEGETRAWAQLREHFEVERELADRLRRASTDERRALYRAAYDELFQRLAHHPQLTRAATPDAARAALGAQMRVVQRFLRPDSTFLEIGAGDCALSIEVARHVRQAYALDVSTEITRQAALPANVELLLSDGTTVPLPPEQVDVAYSNQLMEHLHPDDARAQVSNILRALKPGGCYLCITPHRLSGPHDISRYFADEACGFHLKEYTVTELAALFRGVGFARVRVYLAGRRLRLRVPLLLYHLLEGALARLPHRARRWLTRTKALRVLLGTVVVAER